MNAAIGGGIIVVAGGQADAISAQYKHYAVPRTQFGMRAAQPIGSVRTGSVSGRPAPLPRSRSPNVAQGGTRSTAVVPATGR